MGLGARGASFAEEVRPQIKVGQESSGGRVLRGRQRWSEIVRAVERASGESWEQLAARQGDPALAMALYVGRRRAGLTLRALGESAGGTHYAAVITAIKRFSQRLTRDKALSTTVGRLPDGGRM
jgi:hypothetical protein